MNIVKNEASNSRRESENSIAQQRTPTAQINTTVAQPPPPIQQPVVVEPVDTRWITIDEELFPDVCMPRLLHNNVEYLSVRIIEFEILTHFVEINSPEVIAYGRLQSENLNELDCQALNESNNFVGGKYGQQFTTDDSMVKVSDFLEFYNIIST